MCLLELVLPFLFYRWVCHGASYQNYIVYLLKTLFINFFAILVGKSWFQVNFVWPGQVLDFCELIIWSCSEKWKELVTTGDWRLTVFVKRMGLRKGWGWHCWEGEAWGCRLEVGAHLYFMLHDVILYIWFHAVRLIWRTSMHFLKHFKYIDNYFFLYFVVWGVASWSDFCFTIVHPPGTSEISSNGRWLLILPIYYKEEELHMLLMEIYLACCVFFFFFFTVWKILQWKIQWKEINMASTLVYRWENETLAFNMIDIHHLPSSQYWGR